MGPAAAAAAAGSVLFSVCRCWRRLQSVPGKQVTGREGRGRLQPRCTSLSPGFPLLPPPPWLPGEGSGGAPASPASPGPCGRCCATAPPARSAPLCSGRGRRRRPCHPPRGPRPLPAARPARGAGGGRGHRWAALPPPRVAGKPPLDPLRSSPQLLAHGSGCRRRSLRQGRAKAGPCGGAELAGDRAGPVCPSPREGVLCEPNLLLALCPARPCPGARPRERTAAAPPPAGRGAPGTARPVSGAELTAQPPGVCTCVLVNPLSLCTSCAAPKLRTEPQTLPSELGSPTPKMDVGISSSDGQRSRLPAFAQHEGLGVVVEVGPRDTLL